MTKDINLKSKTWTPIGTSSAPFTGTFNGNGRIGAIAGDNASNAGRSALKKETGEKLRKWSVYKGKPVLFK